MGTTLRPLLFSASTLLFLLLSSSPVTAIGVNYGTLADNLPPPAQVAEFLKTKTTIDRIKIFDINPDILRAFANSGIGVTVTAPNGDIPSLANPGTASQWIQTHIAPFHPKTRIDYILIGNEIMATGDKNLIAHLVPAMWTLHNELQKAGIKDIRITTPHSLGILSRSEPPSIGRFRRGYDRSVFAPMLKFLRETKSSFMVNPYPYFGYDPKKGNYALFKRNPGIHDRFTKITYYNMFDGMMDAVYSAMNAVGYGDVGITIGETGWPTKAEPGQLGVGPDFAATFNGRLINHIQSGKGTPLMPNRKFDAYLFALFNENRKPGPIAEQNWGLFQPDFTPLYDIGIMRGQQAAGGAGHHQKGGGGHQGGGGQPQNPAPAKPAPAAGGKKWCVAKPEASEQALQSNIDYVCSKGVDCKPIQKGGPCFDPNNVRSHASFVMNAFYQSNGANDFNCDFSNTGLVTTSNPSVGACTFA